MMTEDLFIHRILELISVGKALARSRLGDIEMPGQSSYIEIAHGNSRMATAIPRTFRAIKLHRLQDSFRCEIAPGAGGIVQQASEL
jgi:hypothetical protein